MASLVGVVILPTLPAAAASAGRDLALGRSYAMSPAPNYALCTDEGDKAQLTDGHYAAPDTFWGQPPSVGWASSNPVRVIIDLGAIQPIDSVIFSTASRLNAGVHWPSFIVAVSDDGVAYHTAGEASGEGTAAGQDPAREYRRRLVVTGLRTRGRFVMLYVIPGGPYVFCDEIEVIAGSHDPQQVAFRGRGLNLDSFARYVGWTRRRAWLATQCLHLAARARVESRAAAGRGDDTAAEGLRRAEAELRGLSQRIPTLPLDGASLRAAHRQTASLCARVNAALHPDRSFLVWRADAWQPLSQFEALPSAEPALARLEIHAASNEYSSVAVTVTNLTPAPIPLGVCVEDLRGEHAVVPAGDISVRRVEFVQAGNREVFADALPLLDRGRLRLAPGETSQVWLTLPKRRLPPGDYRGRLVLEPRTDAPAATVEVVLRVYPVELPDEMSLQTYNWAYVTTFPLVRGLEKEAVADLFAHYTNTFVFSGGDVPWPRFNDDGEGSIDFTAHDRNLALHRGAREVSWFWSFSDGERPDAGRFGADYLSPQWKERFAWWLRAWVAHLRELGCGYDDFFMYPFDETLCDRFRELAQFIKQVDPRVRIFADPVSHDTRERIEAIAPYVAIWCPHLSSYEERTTDVEFMRAHGDKLWTYACSGPAKALPPHPYYRLMMWKAWQRGFTGCGFWAYADAGWQGDNAWDDFDGYNPDFAVIYTARNAPPGVPRSEAIIPSKRWEAWREGIEDYELLRLVHDAARGAEAAGQVDRAAELRNALRRAVDSALAAPDDPEAAEGARRDLLAVLCG
jgi:hypothetical protein